MDDNQQDTQDATLVEKYRETVLAYERISVEIQGLLQASGGGTERMTDEDYLRYRDMARRRDAIYDMMKRLEIKLLGEDAG